MTFARAVALIVAVWSVLAAAACAPSGVHTADGFAGTFPHAAVAADHPMASEAGARMLARGGNAVDAAVAASFTLSVVRPYSCGIGGGGFMVIHLPDDPTHGAVTVALNYRETSPVGPEFFETTDASSTTGGAAVAVPGTVPGLVRALDRYGTLPLVEVIAPAREAAERGFVVDAHYAGMAGRLIERFEADPSMKSRFPLVWEHFLRAGRVRVGDRITNPAQGRALELIERHGRDAFAGEHIGGAVVEAANRVCGRLTVDMLSDYEPVEMRPMVVEVAGLNFICMPPPSSGGTTIAQAMAILGALGVDPGDPVDTGAERHRLVEALKHAFADRSRWMADPAFETVPTAAMLDPDNIRRIAASVGQRTRAPEAYGTAEALPEDGGTSHVSVVDRWGGAVACTETINLEFGSLVGVDAFGFVLNNEMDDFTTRRGQPNAFGLTQSERNLPAVGKRPLSSMSPTIVLDERGVLAVGGASGGPRIITGTLQALLNALSGMDAGAAVAAPRLHHQWLPDRVDLESGAAAWGEDLAARGHAIGERDAVGNVQLIVRDPAGAGWQAASDPRKGGRPAGH
jgi:gamma-glutamyltranspeptidase/glutathione hydrolase